MQIDIQRLEERIKNLQEIRRIAADPELSTILFDFVSTEDGPFVLKPNVENALKPNVENFGVRLKR